MQYLPSAFRRIPTVFLLTFSSMLLLSVLIIGLVQFYSIRSEKSQMQYFAVLKGNKIVEAIAGLLYKAEALSALVIQDGGEINNFERIAAILINDPAILNVLIAPSGVVSRVYPLTDNEKLIGFDLLGPGAGNKEAILARNTGKLTMGGPFALVQGGQALVGRLPVFFNDETNTRRFWGLVSVTLGYPQSLSSVNLEDIDKLGYATEIWRINPDTQEKQVILRSSDQPLIEPVERKITLLNAEWYISVASTVPWYSRLSFICYALTAFFVSLLVGILGQNYADTWRMKGIMENMAMRDPLTNLPNRRGLFKALEDSILRAKENSTDFTLAYIDLNSFKEINDSYGHGVGDLVLKETAYRVQDAIGAEHILTRIGGDEFIAILNDVSDPDAVAALCTSIEENIARPLRVDEKISLNLSLSIGLASFPQNGTSPDALLHQADLAMYVAKRKAYAVQDRRGHIQK